MYLLHLFPNAEEVHDTIMGCESRFQATFTSQDAAELWFEQEFSDSGWYFLSDDALKEARADEALVNNR